MSASEIVDTRERMLAIAIDVIDSRGEANVRVADICRRSGVTPPVLYYHFSNRDGLVVAAQARRFARLMERDVAAWETILSADIDAAEFRRRVIFGGRDAYRLRSRRHADRLEAMASSLSRPDLARVIAAEQSAIISEIVEVFERYRGRGWLGADVDIPTAVAWIYTLGQARSFVEGSTLIDLDVWTRTAMRSVSMLLFGDPTLPEGFDDTAPYAAFDAYPFDGRR